MMSSNCSLINENITFKDVVVIFLKWLLKTSNPLDGAIDLGSTQKVPVQANLFKPRFEESVDDQAWFENVYNLIKGEILEEKDDGNIEIWQSQINGAIYFCKPNLDVFKKEPLLFIGYIDRELYQKAMSMSSN